MFIGAHMSTNPLSSVPSRTLEIGGNTFQIFSQSPRMWKVSFNEKEVAKFKEEMFKSGINPEKVMIHASYLINLASPRKEVWDKSKDRLKAELEIAHKMGLKYVNVHPGSRLGTSENEAMERVSKAISEILEDAPRDVTLLLEIVSPKGGNIGYNFSQLKRMADMSGCEVKFTYDTCHGFDGGYDICTKEGMERLLDEIDKTIGMDKLVMCHLNDSKFPLNVHKDRHERIGQGYIGKTGFANFFSYEITHSIPMILETPGGDVEHAEDISVVKEIWASLGILE